jgi:hypothetical protein
MAYVPPANYAAASTNTGKGHRLIGPAGAAAILLFFLPWVSVSCRGQQLMSVSGWNLAVGGEIPTALNTTFPFTEYASPILLLMLLAAIACLVVGALVFLRKLPNRLGAIIALASVGIGLGALLIKVLGLRTGQSSADMSVLQIDPQLGLIGFLTAYAVIVGGAVLDLRAKP